MLFVGFLGYYLSSESYQINKSQKKVAYLVETGKKILTATEKYRQDNPQEFLTSFEILQIQLGKNFEVYPGYVEYKKGKDKFLFMLDYSKENRDMLLIANYSQVKSLYDTFQLVMTKDYDENSVKTDIKCKAPVNQQKSCEVCEKVGQHLNTSNWCWYEIKS